jgi:hypothetical protein
MQGLVAKEHNTVQPDLNLNFLTFVISIAVVAASFLYLMAIYRAN